MAKTHLTMGMLPLEHRNRHGRRKRGIVNRQIGVKIQFVTTAESVSESESHVYNVLLNSGYRDASLPSFDSLCERADEQLFGKSLPVLSTYCTAFYPHNGSSTMN